MRDKEKGKGVPVKNPVLLYVKVLSLTKCSTLYIQVAGGCGRNISGAGLLPEIYKAQLSSFLSS